MRWAFTLFMILVSERLHAQEDTLVFYPVNNKNLQQRNIRSITIDDNHKLWLSTNKGIVCYDGNNVQAFSNEYSIFESVKNQENNLFTIQSQGIYRFNTKTGADQYLNISLKPENASPDPRTYTAIYADGNESVWCGRTNGFFHFNIATNKTTFYPLYSGSGKKQLAVRNIQGDINSADILWLGTDDGIYMFDKKLQSLHRNFNCSAALDSLPSDVLISKMHINNTGNIWFAGKRGIGFYDIKKGLYTIYPYKTARSKEADINFKFLQPKSLDEYYIGSSEECPGVFNTVTHHYTFYNRTYKQFPALSIDHFVADSMGNMWCVILGQLYYASVNKNKFKTIALDDLGYQSRARNIFRTAIWDTIRKCYYALFDNSDVIFVLDSSMKVSKSIHINRDEDESRQLNGSHTYDITLDGNGHLWACGTFLSVYDSSAQAMVPAHKLYKALLFKDQRFQNVICRKNYLYLQPSNRNYKAIYRINLSTYTYDSVRIPYEVIPKGYENSWNNGELQEVAVIDKNGRYAYIGTGNYILQADLETGQGRRITRIAVRDNGYYFNLFWYSVDDDGRLWVSSSDGVKVVDPKSLKTVKKIFQDEETQRFQLYNADNMGIMCLLYSGGAALYDYRKNKEYNLSLSDGLMTLFNSGISCVNNILFVGAKLNVLQYLELNSVTQKNVERRCYLSEIQLFNQPYLTDTLPEYTHLLRLPHNKNHITLTFSSTEFEEPEQLKYRYRLQGIDNVWVYTDYLNRTISYYDLKPGNYTFYTSIQNVDGSWNESTVNLNIDIIPAWWQTAWSKLTAILIASLIIYFFVRWRIKSVRRQEQVKAKYEKELLELEAKALRAQMNPHFIFNCMNSIKSLIQKNEQEKAITYLTTFSKLIRIIFQNSDKREISLSDEIETCSLYTKLESMRFGSKLTYHFDVNDSLDLKSVMIPALIIQPFIENAIWHGIMPKEEGGKVTVCVDSVDGVIHCTIDDNGIGREMSKQNTFKGEASPHQSKGMHLTQSRLDLDNILNHHNARIEITDKKDNSGKSTGTKVILTFTDY